MSIQIRAAGLFQGLVGMALVVLSPSLLAAGNWELGKGQYASNCTSCHNLPGGTDAGKRAFPANYSELAVQSRINSGMRFANPQVNDPLWTSNDSNTNDTVSDIVAYLSKTTFPIAQLAPVTTSDFGSISVELTRNLSFRLTNSGTDTLNVGSVSVSNNVNYSVNPNACPTVNAGSSCDIVVTFQPQSASFPLSLNSTLTVNHNAFGGLSTTSMSGIGLTPFTVAPVSPLTFTASTAPAGTRTVNITDNKGDRIRVCRVASATFSAPTDFTLDSPAPFDGGGCYTSATGAVPRAISLVVRFTSGAPGPRFADLTFQRLDGGGNPTGSVTTLQLQGNPGGYATLNASSLFDAAGDPGVEIDNDNTLARSVTLFSQGSAPLPFTGSSFTISGPGSSEYTLAGTGCQTLAQLPAFASGTAPSCVLTVIFNPSDVGRRGPANLTIQVAGIADNVVTLNGLGFRGPRLTVRRGVTPLTSGNIVQFGTQTIGGIYPNIPVTLANGGTLGNLDVILPAAGSVPGFSFTAPAGCAQLAPAAECSVTLHFDPAAIQAFASPFVIQTRPTGTSDPVKIFQLDLRGQGSTSAMPVLGWTDGSGTPITRLDFAATNAGTPLTSSVRLYNAGPGGARLQIGNAIGLDSGNFALDTTDCGTGRELYENTSCVVAVTFAPSTAGQKSVAAQYVAGAGTPLTLVVSPYLAITGTSIASAPPALLQPSASTVQFTSTVVGSAGAPEELKLTNTGSRALNVLGFNVSAPFSVQTKTCAAVPFVLPPGAECTVSVIFQPTAEGSSSATLQITSDASTPITAVALSGSAEPKADLSSGGCSIADGQSAVDPTLWALVLLAAAVLVYRSRPRRNAPRNGRTRR